MTASTILTMANGKGRKWDDVKANAARDQAKKEAIQIAAMAVRFVTDISERAP